MTQPGCMGEPHRSGTATREVRTEFERSLQEWNLAIQVQEEPKPVEALRSHVNVKHMGTLRRKHGKGASLVSHYKEEVQCWIEKNAFFVSDGDGGSEKWELESCQLRPPRSEKLDRFKLCTVAGNQSHQAGGLREVSLMAQTPADAQEWVRAILLSQQVATAEKEFQEEHARIHKALQDDHLRTLLQLKAAGNRAIQTLKDSERHARKSFEKDLEAAMTVRDQALEQNETLRNEQLLLQEQVGRVEGAAITLSTQHLPQDIAEMQHLKDVVDQLTAKNKQLLADNMRLKSEAERLADFANKYHSAEHRIDSLQRLQQQNQLPSTVLQQQTTNAELTEELLQMDRKLREQQRAFSSYSHHLESTIENCMSRLDAIDELLGDLREKEQESIAQNEAVIQWAKQAAGYEDGEEEGRRSIGVPAGLLAGLQEQYTAQRDRLAFLEESDRRVRADCLQTIMLLKSMQAKSRQRGSPFDVYEDSSPPPILRASP